jgi:predicted short-subunit dehydrogenase-like oxidoreductase (DUF2520 family)
LAAQERSPRDTIVFRANSLNNTGQIGIAGAGRIAQAMGRLLRERGEPVAAVASRNAEHAKAAAAFIGPSVAAVSYGELSRRATRILIAVSDAAVPTVASLLARSGMKEGLALHTCGVRGPEALAPLAAQGVECGALHPLQTVATREQGLTSLCGIAFAITANGAAAAWADQIVARLEGRPLRIAPGARPLYHAAAVMASNYIVGMVAAAVELLAAAGIPERDALEALRPLTQASAANAFALGPAKALTGPIARGDLETVAAHLQALAGVSIRVEKLYRAAGLHLTELAGNDREEMERLLNG